MADAATISLKLVAKIDQLQVQLDKAKQKVRETADGMVQPMQQANKRISDSVASSASQISKFGQLTGQQKQIVQNFGYQISDMAVQIGGGTSALRAMGQQLPQMLGSFGPLGAILSAIVAVGIPVATAIMGIGHAAESVDVSLQRLTADVSELQKMNEVYSLKGIQGLIDKYGEANAQVLTLIERQRQYELAKAMADAKTNAHDTDAALVGVGEILKKIADINTAAPLRGAALSAVDLADAVAELKDKFGLTVQQAQDLIAALREMNAATTPQQMADGTAKLAAALEHSSLATGDLYKNILDSEDALLQLTHVGEGIQGWLGLAISGAESLAAQFWSAFTAAKGISTSGGIPSGRTGVLENLNKGMMGRGQPEQTYGLPATVPSTKGHGGGGQDPQAAYDSLMASLDPLIRATKDYDQSLQTVNREYATGAISEAEKARAIDLIKERFDAATGALQQGSDIWASFEKAGANAFDNLISGTGSLKSALRDLVKEMEIALLKQALLGSIKGATANMSVGGMLMKGIGNLLGFRANGGPVQAGQPYVVGERQAELFVPAVSGTILPSVGSMLRPPSVQSAGGGQTLHVQISTDSEYVTATARRAGSAAALPVTVEVVKQAFKAADRRQRTM